jgi:nucleoid-associated protein EbfC
MFEGIDFSKMGALIQEAQKQAQKMQEDAQNKHFSAKSGGGMVSVSMNGNAEVVDIIIDDSLLSDKESLQILLISAINDVFKMVEENKKHAAAQMLSGIGGLGV